jgi:hypothetical protein
MPVLILAAFAATAATVDRVPEDHPTLQHAIDHGDAPVIRLAPGAHDGAVVTRSVHIEGKDATLVGGPRVRGARAGLILTHKADGTTVSGLTFECGSETLDLGIHAPTNGRGAADNITVSGNTFLGCVQGISVIGRAEADTCSIDTETDGGSYWLIQENRFVDFATRTDRGARGGGLGIYAFNAKGIDVVGNSFRGTVRDRSDFSTAAVAVAGCVDCTVIANRFKVQGGEHYWRAVANLGTYREGAVPSQGLLIADNDATGNDAPHLGITYLSYDSIATEIDGNTGLGLVDHAYCGDDALDLVID